MADREKLWVVKLRVVKGASDSIGYVIAYVAPGSVVLWGLSKFSTDIRTWFGIAAEADASVGGFLFIVLAALALGIFVSGVRWLIVDHLLKWMGTEQPDFDVSQLSDTGKLEAFNRLTEGHYRFYQFYANMLVALIAGYVIWINDLDLPPWRRPVALAAVILVSISLFLSARDALTKYNDRCKRLLGEADSA